MGFINSGSSLLYSWFLVLVLSAGFCLGSTVSADAQEWSLPGKTLLDTTFNIDKWKRQLPRSVTVYYGKEPFLDASFTYKGSQYSVWGVSSGYPKNKVKIGIDPSFPPAGSNRSQFDLYVGSVGGELTRFNFGDSNCSPPSQISSTRTCFWNEWPGHAGFRSGYIVNNDRIKNGRLKITAIDESVGNNLEFSSYFPKPAKNSSGDNISGRLQVVYGEGNTYKRWRICNRDGNHFIEEAKVACRQMGLPVDNVTVLDINEETRRGIDFGTAENPTIDAWIYAWNSLDVRFTPVLLDKIECEGDENKLTDCNHLGLGIVSDGYCPVANTAVVRCN